MNRPRTQRAHRWAHLTAMTWKASPLRCSIIMMTFAVDIVGLPLLAFILRDFTNAALHGHRDAALRYGVIAALTWAISDQGIGVRNLLRNDLREQVGLALSERRLHLVSGIPGIAHLEDPHALDQIHIGENGQQVADVVCAAAETIANILAVGATLVVLSSVSPWLMLLLPLGIPTLWFNRRGQTAVRTAMDKAAQPQRIADSLMDRLLDPVSAIELRVTGAGQTLLDEYEQRWNTATRTIMRAKVRAALWLAAGWLIFLGGYGGALILIVWNISHGHGSPGDLVFMLAIARQQQQLIQETVLRFRNMLEGLQVAEAYFWLQDSATEHAEVHESQVAIPQRLTHGIDLEHVSFAYPGTDRKVLDDITLHLRAGSMVALVGPHGSGKTSIVKLLTQMYQPTEGRIVIDGTTSTGLSVNDWRERTSAAFQDFVRFQTLAMEAVGVGDLPHQSDRTRVRQAIHLGGAETVMDTLPEGLDTQLGSVFSGVNLSGGQWQKLALARACMRNNPLLLVLDEPTAALDPISEYKIFRHHLAIARRMGKDYGTVTIIISHRFSTVRMADQIVVLAGGAVIEQGSHESLIGAQGTYAGMYEAQQRAYLDGERHDG